MKDHRVPLLRERLHVAGKHDDLLYDRKLYNAIRALQHHADLRASGVIDNKTLAAINGPSAGQEIDAIDANMERWRWLPRDLGRTYVMVNIPDYTLKVDHDNQVTWRTKIVAGKPQTPTPLLSASMDTVLVNPSWYVPQSIIQNELLPLYASDPNIFDRMGLEVKKGPDGNINVVQPPGAANALGRIKFNFPNKFQVYLHDTPEKRLFAADKRAFSHGCMRVEDPTKFGEVMLHLAMSGPDAELAAARCPVRQGREDLQADQSPDGAPDLPDRLRRRSGQVANARRTSTASMRASTPSCTPTSAASPMWLRRRTPSAIRERPRATRKSCAGSSGVRPQSLRLLRAAVPLKPAQRLTGDGRAHSPAIGLGPVQAQSSIGKIRQPPPPRPLLAMFGK